MGIAGRHNLPIAPTSLQMLQQCTFHVGIVRDVKDPDGKGRIKVEVPSLWGDENKDCWSGWLQTTGVSCGSCYRDGDHGMWIVPVPGERVLVGFVGGDAYSGFVLPGPIWQTEPGKNKALIPLEAKKITESEGPRAGTRLRIIKTESGATWMVDDNGKKEAMMLVDWTGAGMFFDAPGKKEDHKEKDGEPSIFRNAERRLTKTVAAQSSKKPSELIEGGSAVTSFLDLLGQGTVQVVKDGSGLVTIFATKEVAKAGPSIILDAKNNLIILTAGEAQLVVNGKKGHISTTRKLIQEQEPIEVEELFKQLFDRLKKTFKRFFKPDAEDMGQGKPEQAQVKKVPV